MEAVRSERSSAHQARRLGQRLPLAETYTGLMQGCVAAGEGELDNSVVINEIRRRRA
jgi:3-hydroxyisobutyrate dehydrogenase-like beta-hydroxyacid dehydrogenase